MTKCAKCGVRGDCGCLFTRTPEGLVCGVCTGRATHEKAAEIRYLRTQQGVVAHAPATPFVEREPQSVSHKTATAIPAPSYRNAVIRYPEGNGAANVLDSGLRRNDGGGKNDAPYVVVNRKKRR